MEKDILNIHKNMMRHNYYNTTFPYKTKKKSYYLYNNYKIKKNINHNICCVNCGEKGHIIKECNAPITSYGIIAYKINFNCNDELYDKNSKINELLKTNNIVDESEYFPEIKFLMIQRKDTMGYIDFLRGKYNNNTLHICIIEMTEYEKNNILNKTFDELWKELWVCTKNTSNFYKQDYHYAKIKFNNLNIKELFKNTKSIYNFSEFTLPKGRQNLNETKLECAIREFSEETRISYYDYDFIENYPTIIEQFIGTNGIMYKHVYYLVKMKDSTYLLPNIEGNLQLSEVKNIGWFSKKECLQLIRPYDLEKKKIISQVHKDILNLELIV